MRTHNRRETLPLSAVCAVLILILANPVDAFIEGLNMVGIGAPPDSVTDVGAGCAWKLHDVTGTEFETWTLPPEVQQLDQDLDLLVSTTFDTTYGTDVSRTERVALLRAFHDLHDNVFSYSMTDLELVYNYLSDSSEYSGGFEVFANCGTVDTIPLSRRNHIDVYLYKHGNPTPGFPHCNEENKYEEYGDHAQGNYPSHFTHHDEDPPYDAGTLREWHSNSVGVSDRRGNCLEVANWPLHSAEGVSHEFSHMLWASNKASHGARGTGFSFNEQLATAGAFIGKPATGDIAGGDVAFGQSILGPIKLPFGLEGCGEFGVEDTLCYQIANWEDCRVRYPAWTLWSAYLAEQYHFPSDYSLDALYGWARFKDDQQKLARDICGLARVFDGAQFDTLGLGGSPPHPGEERLARVFNDFSIAKWVDSGSLSARYDFGTGFSPSGSVGLFKKLDMGDGQYSVHNCWEIAIPPRHVVGESSEGSWLSVPGNASGCVDGWNDPDNDQYCQNGYCHPVEVSLWGSDYIVFQADTTHFAGADGAYLRVVLEWDSNDVSPGTKLWVNLLKYGCAHEHLYARGDSLLSVDVYSYSATDTLAAFNIHNFGEGGVESAVFVLTLVQTDYSRYGHGCYSLDDPEFCMQRILDPYGDDDDDKDLPYSYSYSVYTPVPGGCPFVEIHTENGWAADNNVLVGAVHGEDSADSYVLSNSPAVRNGHCELRLVEPHGDVSHFDSVKLLAIDHPVGTAVGTDARGNLVIYRREQVDGAVCNENGDDLSGVLSDRDNRCVVLAPGSWVQLSVDAEGTRAGGGIGVDGAPGHKIEPPPGRQAALPASTLDLTHLCTRALPTSAVFDIPNHDGDPGVSTSTVRVTAPVEFHLDRLTLTELVDDRPVTQPCELISARHSEAGHVLSALARDDDVRVELAPGDTLSFVALVPDAREGLARDFIVVTAGYYESSHRQGPASDGEAAVAGSSGGAFPNPFNPATTVRFTVASPGGLTSVHIYNIAGRLVRDLGTEELAPGIYDVSWDGCDRHGERVASGTYFCRVLGPGGVDQHKLLLVK